MNLIDIIFGKKKKIKHPILGQLKSQRIKRNVQTKVYKWYGKVTLNNKPEVTILILKGNNSNPFSSHLNFVSELVGKWDIRYFPKIEERISKEIDSQKGEYSFLEFSNWRTEFYVDSIQPLDDLEAEYELYFLPLNNEKKELIIVEFKDKIITKIDFH